MIYSESKKVIKKVRSNREIASAFLAKLLVAAYKKADKFLIEDIIDDLRSNFLDRGMNNDYKIYNENKEAINKFRDELNEKIRKAIENDLKAGLPKKF